MTQHETQLNTYKELCLHVPSPTEYIKHLFVNLSYIGIVGASLSEPPPSALYG